MPAFARISMLLVVLAVPRSYAQDAPRPDGVRISLLTIRPGTDIYSLWGHSALRVTDDSEDVSFNYGTFDFQTDFFVARFLQGSLDYMLSAHDVDAALRHYRAEGRAVIEQVLDLTPDQTNRLVRFLRENHRPENRSYRYDFLFDNCSTRVRDALLAALGSEVSFADAPDPGRTFRDLIDPYQDPIPFLDAGIDWLLGAPVDRIATPSQTMFLPDYLMEAFANATVQAGGRTRPLVARTDTLLWIDGSDGTRASFPWAIIAGWLLLIVGVAVTARADGPVRAFDAPLFSLVGLAGLLIAYLWFISLHDVTNQNWHLIWSWPTHLVAAVALLLRRPPAWLAAYLAAGAVAAVAATVTAPFWPQGFHPALVPVALVLALRGGAVFIAGHPLRRSNPASAA